MAGTAAIALAGLQALNAAQAKAVANNAAEKSVQAYQGIKEVNELASLKVPTLGTNLAKQNLEQRTANELNILQQAGADAVLGGVTRVNENAMREDLNLAAEADERQYQRDLAVAQQQQNIETNRVNRQANLIQSQIAGAQAARAEANQDYNSGMAGVLEGLSGKAELNAYNKLIAANQPNKFFGKDLNIKPQNNTFDWGSIFKGLGIS